MLPRNRLRPRFNHPAPMLMLGGFVVTVAALLASGEGYGVPEQAASVRPVQVALPAQISLPMPELPAAALVPPSPAQAVHLRKVAAITGAASAPTALIDGSVAPVAAWMPASAEEPPAAAPLPALQVAAAEPAPEAGEPPATAAVIHLPVAQPAPRPAAARPAGAALSPLVLGRWVPDREACTNPDGTEYLPLLIGAAKASAGEAACRFGPPTRRGATWSLLAECTDGTSEWTSRVSLAVADGRLTWSSEKGVQTYMRCEEDIRIAKRPTKTRVAAIPAPRKARTAARTAAKTAPKTKPTMRITGDDGSVQTWALAKTR